MTQPTVVTSSPHYPLISRLLFFLGFICAVVGAIDAGTSLTLGPAIAWICGWLAAVSLAWAVG